MFHGTGQSKAAARFNVAQTAMNALGPKIEAELERRKVEKQQKIEERKTERLERLKEKIKAEEGGDEVGSCSSDNVKMESVNGDNATDGNTSGNTEQKCQATEQNSEAITAASDGTGDGQETKPRARAIGALRVLKDIRPGIACTEKAIPGAPDGYYGAKVVVDGCEFEGDGDSLSKAKALAAASSLTALFNLSFEYSPRKNTSCYVEVY